MLASFHEKMYFVLLSTPSLWLQEEHGSKQDVIDRGFDG